MKAPAKPALPPAATAEPFLPLEVAAQALAVADVEIRKLLRDPTEIVSRSLQPVLWLVIFGSVFNRARVIPTGNVSYLTFLAPGVLAQSVLFASIFFGIAVIWEKDLGIVHKLLVSPAHRVALVLGKSVSAGFRGLMQGLIVYALSLVMGIDLALSPLHILGTMLLVVLGAGTFATFSLIVACWVRTRERFMGIGQVMTMPLFFASSAIYPLSIMPLWLRGVALVNPLTYMVDGLRALMVVGAESSHSLAVDAGVLALAFVLLVLVAARLYPRLAR